MYSISKFKELSFLVYGLGLSGHSVIKFFKKNNIENYKVFNPKGAGNEIIFKQDDISTSVKHTLRGLHGDTKTWKLVQCLYGSLLQVVVDFREDSSTYLQYDMFPLNDKNRNQILIPPGHINGHLVMSESAIFSYKQSTLYGGPGSQFTIKWDDPKINIPKPKKITIDVPNNHLKYAITWYSISISIFFYYLYFRKKK